MSASIPPSSDRASGEINFETHQTGREPGIEPKTIEFYRTAMQALQRANIAFMVGGAYALTAYTGITRHTKDFDIFLLPRDVSAALAALAAQGFQTKIQADYWLAKAFCGDQFIDLIFNSGNGIARVDETWLLHAPEAEVFGMRVKLIPPEEMIWSKSFVMERERYDGADVEHLLLKCAARMDWERLLARFGQNWRVLLNYFVLFGYIYPGQRDRVPRWVMDRLLGLLQADMETPPPDVRVCNGTVLSRQQYLPDVTEWGFADGRLTHGYMTPSQIEEYIAALVQNGSDQDPHLLHERERELEQLGQEQHEATTDAPTTP